MPIPISVIIITRNEASRIADCVNNAKLLSDDVIVVDAESTDKTQQIARDTGAHVVVQKWMGYGQNRNVGAKVAKHDWIFSLDADEHFSQKLIDAIRKIDFTNINSIYACHRLTYIGEKPIRHGDWAHDIVTRLYNKTTTQWNNATVHEQIEKKNCILKTLEGDLLHYSFSDTEQLFVKARYYSQLNAQKYLDLPSKRKNARLKMIFSPIMAFLKTYIFRVGFLDGKEGFAIARAAAFSAHTKYKLLSQLQKEQH